MPGRSWSPGWLRSIDVLETLAELFVTHGVPAHIRSDNGPEFTAELIRLWLEALQVQTLFIEPGSPWENGYVESFNGKLRDELLDREIFYTLTEAQILIERWRRQYNTVRPHSALGYRPPTPEAVVPTPIGGLIMSEASLIRTGTTTGGRSWAPRSPRNAIVSPSGETTGTNGCTPGGGAIVNRLGKGAGSRARPHTARPVMMTATADIPSASGSACRHPARGCEVATGAGAVFASSIARRASVMSDNRRFRSFSRLRRSKRRSGSEVFAGSSAQFGSVFSTDARTCDTVSPVNSRCPVSISNKMMPKDQISLRLSAVCPAACSGDIYAAVP